jgi:hypothetical protein
MSSSVMRIQQSSQQSWSMALNCAHLALQRYQNLSGVTFRPVVSQYGSLLHVTYRVSTTLPQQEGLVNVGSWK